MVLANECLCSNKSIERISLGALSLSEFHPSTTSLDKAAEGFLTSATFAAVVAVMLAIMLSFRFEGHVSATRLDLLIAWTPLVLLDWSIFGVLVGLVLWYGGKNNVWRASIMTGIIGSLLGFNVWVATWMWQKMSTKGRLGEEESKAFREVKEKMESSK
ncbi:uncharacterized protein PAC_08064 [Phialocephala subalpina]|uniref:Uncharacterized protein n=1 Tax=Phialocephala subalpina TaxID=576137 RepID=A0A1L7WZG9_9HELO|nr:uncharacterized protein PAC_08064 [Phialocephala subalpina]